MFYIDNTFELNSVFFVLKCIVNRKHLNIVESLIDD